MFAGEEGVASFGLTRLIRLIIQQEGLSKLLMTGIVTSFLTLLLSNKANTSLGICVLYFHFLLQISAAGPLLRKVNKLDQGMGFK